MIDWYTTVLNTGHCELTPLMSMSIYIPAGLVTFAVMTLIAKRVK